MTTTLDLINEFSRRDFSRESWFQCGPSADISFRPATPAEVAEWRDGEGCRNRQQNCPCGRGVVNVTIGSTSGKPYWSHCDACAAE